MRAFVPGRGDLIWLSFEPQAGHEQAGHRLALVLSPREYNEKVGLSLVCPVTSKVKGYPFEVEIPACVGVEGVILSDQVRSLDWRARRAGFIGRLPEECLKEVLRKIRLLLN